MKVLVIFLLFVFCVFAGSPDDWKQRTIYQVLIDRFSRTSGDTSPCNDLHNYCGGTFQGLINHLDFIQGIGFDAIWISPIVSNTPGGYHGYWAQDITTINSNFGTQQDLTNLITECHKRGIWVMLDVVANHVGPVGYDYSSIKPFNNQQYYHDCNSCPPGCDIDFNAQNQTEIEICRLSALPDLNQDNQFVSSTLLNWVQNIVSTNQFDGLRIDTVPEVSKDFWAQFMKAAGVFTIGEVFDSRIPYVAGYQGSALHSTLSYPLFFTLTNVFAHQQSMNQLQDTLAAYKQYFPDPSILGTFLENHDNNRFGNIQNDRTLYKNGLTFILMAQGIPIVYYGSTQGFNGGGDPNNREPMWTSNFNTNTDLYNFIKTLVGFRKAKNIQGLDQVQRYSDNNFYAFTRGSAVFVATTNVGQNGQQIVRNITYQPFANGTKLCNLFYPSDCVQVENGSFTVYLDNGESKVYSPQ